MPEVVAKLKSGKEVKLILDEDGFLQNWEDWNEEIAEWLAEKEGIKLTDEHWEVVRYLRKYYEQYRICPPIRMLVREMKKVFKEKFNKDFDLKYLYQLFPLGPAKQACKFAGAPKPTGCV